MKLKELEQQGEAFLKKQKIITIAGFVFIVLLLLLYNHKRSMGYHFNINEKIIHQDISYNLLLFKNLKYILTNHLERVILKLLFFTIIGVIFCLIKYFNRNIFKIHIFIILVVLFIDIIHIFTGFLVAIDINNWFVYMCGILIGYNLTNIIFSKFIKNQVTHNQI